MNKKGFTLIELILVITLMAVISVLVIPNILDALNSSKQQKYESLYKLIEKNMKLYNDKYEVDLWSNNTTNTYNFCSENDDGCSSGISKLKDSGSDINLDDCKIKLMTITKEDTSYNYNLILECGDDDNKALCTRDEINKLNCN